MLTTICYLAINDIFVPKVILGKANYERMNHQCTKAIGLYNIAYFYYYMNHFSQNNKEIYFEIPYKISLCYLENHNKRKAIESMFKGILAVENQYGVYSPEMAYFIRKYLIEFYLLNNSYKLACGEYSNALIIYRKIGYNSNDIADMIRLKGDLAYQQKDYPTAIQFYQNAYDDMFNSENVDYDILAKITNRICDYEALNGNVNNAIERYKKSIDFLRNSGKKQSELTVQMLLRLGDLYSRDDKQIKNAISCYEEAIKMIESLPATTFSKKNISTYLTTLKSLYTQNGQYHETDEVDIELARKRRFSFL